jgi:BNR repeat protein
MTKRFLAVLLAMPLAVSLPTSSRADDQTEASFVQDGLAKDAVVVGKPWQQGDGYLECSGLNNYLYAGKALGSGDVHIRVRLALLNIAASAASISIDTRDHLGFDGGGKQGMFVSGPLLGKLKFIGPYSDFIEEAKPFELEVVREGTQLQVLIDGKPVHECTDRRDKFGTIALRPWRATMRVYDFSASGNLEKAFIPSDIRLGTNTPFAIPAIDLSSKTDRHVIVAQGTATDYKGHPTTLLMPDGKTMFCVYPLGHGGPSAVLRRSDDGGLTWSEPLDVPDNWRQSNNCPALFRLVGTDEKERLFVFEGNGHMRQACSEDGGRTWSPMAKNGLKTVMPFTAVIRLKDGRFMGGWNWQKSTWISFSNDGGLTWGPQRCIAKANDEFPGAWPCEPAFIRSPDGNEIACLMRENSRRYMSMAMFTRDEGQTWNQMRELPRELTGDRHQPRYSSDGRLVIPSRDTAPASPTKGHFIAWVGTYDDIAAGRPGQYRVKLLHSHAGSDCGYPGLELLPDETFVATTYVKYRPGTEKQSVVSARFKLSEIDALAEAAK